MEEAARRKADREEIPSKTSKTGKGQAYGQVLSDARENFAETKAADGLVR